ncbi:facilitated trehalose transporter Tret1-like [Leptopilina boulardi]|uniref:facilitated trehalose transporter Tret1-like n=1 Tax=Leptopilina boulardi TaxID=63433 RepID=UPI0021F629EA|nr:facilitated trehalose transporter Tret1-like [Leptopilina boulardi]
MHINIAKGEIFFRNMRNESLILETKNSDLQNYSTKTKCSLQYPAAITACLIRLGFGTANYWTSPAVPHLISSNSSFTITPDEASWIVSLISFGSIIGFILYPIFINQIGRKYTMLLFTIPQVFSWLTIYYASNIYHLYVARILSGIGYAAGYIVEIIYIGEIAEKNIRGILIVIGKIAYILGSLIVVILGAFVSYDNMNLILLLISLLFFLTFTFMPESPYFCVNINRDDDAVKNLIKLRGRRDIKKIQLEIKNMKQGLRNNILKRNSMIKLFTIESNRKALLIATLGTLGFILSGYTVIAAYTQTIVSYIDCPLKSEEITVLIMMVVLISCIIFAPLTDLIGRRILILLFSIITGFSSITIGGFFFYKYHQNGNISSIYWITLIIFLIYIIASSAGLFPLSHILLAEIFSIEVKSTAIALINILWAVVEFFLKLSFERLIEIIGIYSVFWIYGILTIIVNFSNFIIMPETKGKTLEEIQELF